MDTGALQVPKINTHNISMKRPKRLSKANSPISLRRRPRQRIIVTLCGHLHRKVFVGRSAAPALASVRALAVADNASHVSHARDDLPNRATALATEYVTSSA
jgi:hypothetical protein